MNKIDAITLVSDYIHCGDTIVRCVRCKAYNMCHKTPFPRTDYFIKVWPDIPDILRAHIDCQMTCDECKSKHFCEHPLDKRDIDKILAEEMNKCLNQ